MTRRRGISAAEDVGLQALLDSGAPVCTIVGKTWDFQVTDVLRVTLDENLDMIGDSIRFLNAAGRQVFYDAEHFFDGWKANPEYAAQTIRAAAEAGASLIVLCDTNGGSLPEEISEMTRRAVECLQPLGVPVGIHCHNDCELAVANSLAAVDAGAVQVQGTINGLGERCGNADLISVIANLALKKKGYQVLGGSGLQHLTQVVAVRLRDGQSESAEQSAVCGAERFRSQRRHARSRSPSGLGVLRAHRSGGVGNERRFLVSELSGRSNIVAMTVKHNLRQDRELMDRILAEVVRLENRGYQFEAAEASFDLLVKRCAGTFVPHFELLKYHIEVAPDTGRDVVTEATVKLRVGGECGTRWPRGTARSTRWTRRSAKR
jgi:2-isopropylmalate synthase